MVVADEELWVLIDNIDEIKPNEYSISSEGHIRSSLFEAHDPEYKSTNGYDYTLMACTDGTLRLFKVDKLMVMIFNKIPKELLGLPIWIKHINGNTRDNHLDNLEVEFLKEEWRVIEDPELFEGMYAISNYGRVKHIGHDRILKQRKNLGYWYISLLKNNGKSSKTFRVHRLVAKHFISKIDGLDEVNHIDGNKMNNMVDNLEWLNRSLNQTHAVFLGLQTSRTVIDGWDPSKLSSNINVPVMLYHIEWSKPKPIKQKSVNVTHKPTSSCCISVDTLDDIRDIIIANPNTYKSIIYEKYPFMTYTRISKLRENLPPYNVSNRYDVDDFKRRISKTHVIPPEVQDMVRDMLLDPQYYGNTTMVYNAIDHDKYPIIWNASDVMKIKMNTIPHYRLSVRYDVDTIKFPVVSKHECSVKSRISTEVLDIVRDELLKPEVGGQCMKAYRNLKDQYPELSYYIIKDIRYNKPCYKRSNKYDLDNLDYTNGA